VRGSIDGGVVHVGLAIGTTALFLFHYFLVLNTVEYV
jgi:hypothetical protein